MNLRADDILYTSLLYAYLLISKNEKPCLYINKDKINNQLKAKIEIHLTLTQSKILKISFRI